MWVDIFNNALYTPQYRLVESELQHRLPDRQIHFNWPTEASYRLPRMYLRLGSWFRARNIDDAVDEVLFDMRHIGSVYKHVVIVPFMPQHRAAGRIEFGLALLERI